MSRTHKAEISVSPWTVGVLALFITLASADVLAAVLMAALCHELGHYFVLRAVGGRVERIRISPFGAEMCLAQRPILSYGREAMAVAAGPAVNLVLAYLLAHCGLWWESLYTFAGAQMILGAFNLLPVRPLDGGRLLWTAFAWGIDPAAADGILCWIERFCIAMTVLLALWIWRMTGSPFLLLAAVGLGKSQVQEKKLVKGRKRR